MGHTPATNDIAILRRAGRWAAGLFWIVQFLELTVVSLTEPHKFAYDMLLPRAIVMVTGALLTLPIIEVAARSGHRRFRFRLLATVGTALAMCMILLAANCIAFFTPLLAKAHPFDLTDIVYSGFGWSWFFLGMAGAIVGLSYSLEVRERERRLADMEIVAREARLSALRHQLNPHFLFNTLNSIAALIDAHENAEAEAMVEGLSDFLRATLELDPVADIRLSQETALQQLYLSIEKIRFPDRLVAEVEIAHDVADVLVPPLILQPVVENAVLHGVARSLRPVTIRIAAYRSADRVQLLVENDVPSREGVSHGTGVGLENVRSRLSSRFGSDQSFEAGRLDGKYRIVLELPDVKALTAAEADATDRHSSPIQTSNGTTRIQRLANHFSPGVGLPKDPAR